MQSMAERLESKRVLNDEELERLRESVRTVAGFCGIRVEDEEKFNNADENLLIQLHNRYATKLQSFKIPTDVTLENFKISREQPAKRKKKVR